MFMSDWSPLMTPQKVTLDSMCTLSFVLRILPTSSYQIQVSMSAAALDIYLYESSNNMLYRTVH